MLKLKDVKPELRALIFCHLATMWSATDPAEHPLPTVIPSCSSSSPWPTSHQWSPTGVMVTPDIVNKTVTKADYII